MPLQLSPSESAALANLETQLETAFMTGAEYPPATVQVAKLDAYDRPMVVNGRDLTSEMKPKVKGPFKLLVAALMKAVQPWQAPTLVNSWTNYGGGFAPAGYYRDFMGRIHLRGLVKDGNSAPMFLLPAGYRPQYTLIFPVVSADAFGVVRILPDGTVSATLVNNNWVSLDGISFRE